MALLKPLTRDEIPVDLHALWDECERAYPDFRNLWATMAHSPIVFRSIWGQLLAFKRESPVEARHFEIAILVVSGANRCEYCVAHHTPRALGTGLSAAQIGYLAGLRLEAVDPEAPPGPHPGFDEDESLVIDLARVVMWSGLYAPAAGAHPRAVHALRHRLFDRLAARFPPRQIEELVWRTAQCVAFNWHNDLLELDLEPSSATRAPA